MFNSKALVHHNNGFKALYEFIQTVISVYLIIASSKMNSVSSQPEMLTNPAHRNSLQQIKNSNEHFRNNYDSKDINFHLQNDNANLNGVLAVNETYTYIGSYTPSYFSFIIPPTGSYKLHVDAYGSQGIIADVDSAKGGHIECHFNVNPGDIFNIRFGGGAGKMQYTSNTGSSFGVVGGGSSELSSSNSILLVAGGGGATAFGSDGIAGAMGGAGGGFVGADGNGGQSIATGGSQENGGKNGPCAYTFGTTVASKGQGGNGCRIAYNPLYPTPLIPTYGGGAGGGGYYGGGGAGDLGSGAGGSSYCTPYADMIRNEQGHEAISGVSSITPSYENTKAGYMIIKLLEILPVSLIQADQSLTFSSGRNKTFQIPYTGQYQLIVDAYGSKGKNSKYGGEGGNGGYIQCILDAVPGQVYYVDIGDTLQNGGGGAGYSSDQSLVLGNGGGATSLRTNITDIIGSRVVVAAGGGGGGYTFAGGDGGGNIGADGSVGVGAVATGGTQIKGGKGGYNGKLGQGGNGFNSGGGGGGYYGGGAGTFHGGGAGGSNYCMPKTATIISNKQGVNDREGYLIVTLIDVTAKPTNSPTAKPSVTPTSAPSAQPTYLPTTTPSRNPSTEPSYVPTTTPSTAPSRTPTFSPSPRPSVSPTSLPSKMPSIPPQTTAPSIFPTVEPSVPTSTPSMGTIAPSALTLIPTSLLLISSSSNKSNQVTQVTIGVSVVGGLCLLAVLLGLFLYSRRKKHSYLKPNDYTNATDSTYNENFNYAPASSNNDDDAHIVYCPMEIN